jgi:hypothetical protein
LNGRARIEPSTKGCSAQEVGKAHSRFIFKQNASTRLLKLSAFLDSIATGILETTHDHTQSCLPRISDLKSNSATTEVLVKLVAHAIVAWNGTTGSSPAACGSLRIMRTVHALICIR